MASSYLMMAMMLFCIYISSVHCRKIHYIHWNRANPMFRLDNTDHIIDVNTGNLPWEYDQVNIICPVSKADTKYPERHVIYSVSREEFESCRITNPKPRIVAVCSKPHQLLYFTITFRSFSPTPGGLEFHPGQDYYFISTSSAEDLHRRVGGGCSTHNMKMIFKVSDNNNLQHHPINAPRNDDLIDSNEINPTTIAVKTSTTTVKPVITFNSHDPAQRNNYIYYYHPRDLIDLDENSLKFRKALRESEQALRLTSAASNPQWMTSTALATIMVLSFFR